MITMRPLHWFTRDAPDHPCLRDVVVTTNMGMALAVHRVDPLWWKHSTKHQGEVIAWLQTHAELALVRMGVRMGLPVGPKP